MWGICLDVRTYQYGLFQSVVYYKEDDKNNKAIILLPIENYILDIEKIKKLPTPPRYRYYECVFHCNHPDTPGVVVSIGLHSKKNCYFYKIKVNEKVKSFRYFERDLLPYVPH